jgi:hypothetical protein
VAQGNEIAFPLIRLLVCRRHVRLGEPAQRGFQLRSRHPETQEDVCGELSSVALDDVSLKAPKQWFVLSGADNDRFGVLDLGHLSSTPRHDIT